MTSQGEAYFAYLRQRSKLGHWYRRAWLYPRLCRHLHGRVLDVGCGIGDMLRFRPGTEGVDINPETVNWCRRQGLPARLMTTDELPFEAASFDGVILDNVLEHILEPGRLLGEIRRVIRSSGTLVIGVPGQRGFAADPDHKVFYDEALLESTLQGAGYVLHRILRMPLPGLSGYLRSYCLYGVFGVSGTEPQTPVPVPGAEQVC